MAGHSKWANIQHRKKRQDAKRGKLFTKLIKEITVAARDGGGDADSNPRLRLALDKAFAGNMNKDTIEKAIKRGTGNLDSLDFLRYLNIDIFFSFAASLHDAIETARIAFAPKFFF